MKKLLFVFNPHSGRAQIKNNLIDIVDIFTKGGYNVTIYPTQAPNDCFEKIKNEACEYNRVVVSGGDGTLNEAVHGMLSNPEEKRVPIGYIPTGTVNDFSNSLGIPKDMLEAAEIAVVGKTFECDICKFNGRPYNYVAAFGAFTDVSYETPQGTKNIFGQAAYFFEGIKKLSSIQKYHAKVRYDDVEIEDDFVLGMILNSKSVAGFEVRDENGIMNNISLDDGMFEGVLVRMPTNLVEFQTTISDFLRGNMEGAGYVSFKTSHVEFEFDDAVKWTLDGEFGGACEYAEIKLLNKAVTFIVDKEI
ncbi:MAG: diacylglycerol/lipid kinase family protein [Clostridia bacterium]